MLGSQRGSHHLPYKVTGKVSGVVRQQKTGLRGEFRRRPFTGVFMGKAVQGRVNGFRSASVSNSSRLCTVGAAPGCLVLGPAVIKAEECCFLAF